LVRTNSWAPAVAGGSIAGPLAASDGLLWFAGVAPFALAAAFLYRTTRRRDIALRASMTVALTLVTAVITNVVMRALDWQVEGLTVSLASIADLPGNVVHLGRMLALLGGANYALLGPYPSDPLRLILALLTVAGVAMPLVAAVRVSRADTTLRVYAFYWAAVVIVLCFVFVVTPNATALGPKSVTYILSLAFAAGAGVAVLARGVRAQLLVALGVATVAAVNISSIVDGRAEVTGVVALPQQAPRIIRVLERAGATRGYAGFWDAGNLTWQSDMRLLVAPVNNCGDELCPNNFFTVRSFYEPQGGPTFLLVDATLPLIHAPPFASRAAETHRFGPITLYVFHYDISQHIRLLATS
jgi:hypothetical protein